MALLKNTGKPKVFDGSGTSTPVMHTGHGAHPERAKPHMRQMALAQPSKDEKRKARLDNQKKVIEDNAAPGGDWKPTPGRRDGKGRLLPDNWGSQELDKVTSQPSHGMPDVGSFYSQAHSLARTRFIQPTKADTAQLPPGIGVGVGPVGMHG